MYGTRSWLRGCAAIIAAGVFTLAASSAFARPSAHEQLYRLLSNGRVVRAHAAASSTEVWNGSLCWSAYAGGTVQTCNNSANQTWSRYSTGYLNGGFESAGDGLCLNNKGGGTGVNNPEIMYTCYSSENESYNVTDTAGGNDFKPYSNNGICVGMENVLPGGALALETCGGNAEWENNWEL
jgi:hypothetical protein